MQMCETINRQTGKRRHHIDGKLVSREAFGLAEIKANMRGAQFHSFNLQCTDRLVRHLKCVDARSN